MDNAKATDQVVRSVRAVAPELAVYARARDVQHGIKLLRKGVSEVVPETLEASLQLAGRVLRDVGVSEEVVSRRVEEERLREGIKTS